MSKKFRPVDPAPLDGMNETFRRVRKLRRKPAHAVDEDLFDQKYFREQRSLIVDAYGGVRTLRLTLSNHPASRAVTVPGWVDKGEIWAR